MKKVKIHKCSKCNKSATWFYLPATRGKFYFCDDCVPRGCTCNVDDIDMVGPDKEYDDRTIWWSKDVYEKCIQDGLDTGNYATKTRQADSFYYETVDDKGRRDPCCEYSHSEDGFEIVGNYYTVEYNDVWTCLTKALSTHIVSKPKMIKGIEDVIEHFTWHNHVGDYTHLMSKIADICEPYTYADINCKKIYLSLRSELYEKRKKVER